MSTTTLELLKSLKLFGMSSALEAQLALAQKQGLDPE
jgi:hypothetical protein